MSLLFLDEATCGSVVPPQADPDVGAVVTACDTDDEQASAVGAAGDGVLRASSRW